MLQDLLDFFGEAFAGAFDLSQIVQLGARLRSRLRFFDVQVSEVTDFIPELRDSSLKTRDAQCSWTKLDTSHTRTVRQRHAQDAHRLFRLVVCRALVLIVLNGNGIRHTCPASHQPPRLILKPLPPLPWVGKNGFNSPARAARLRV